MDISLAKLNQLVKVAQTRNFSRAAEELGQSQPGLSRSISTIEERYGVRIFDRGRSGAVLTSAGRLIVEEAESLLRSARKLDHNLKLYGKGDAGRLALGFSSPIAGMMLGDLSIMLFSQRAKLQLETLIRPPAALNEALINDEIEFFISPDYGREPHVDIEIRQIGTIQSVFVVRAQHPLLECGKATVADLTGFPVASPIIPDWLPSDGPVFAAFACDNFHIMRDVTLKSDTVLICPPSFILAELANRSLVSLTLDPSPLLESKIVVGTVRGRAISPIAAEAITFCQRRLATDAV